MTLTAQSLLEPPDAAFDHLRTSKSSYRLNQIERIRANGVGELVALPQLVVCGDQSAGKSSVLEGITGIPFPRQEGLCTRFPTEIILRHRGGSDEIKISASIRPHASRTPQDQETLSSYQKDIEDMSELPCIIHDVSILMKIRGYVDCSESCAFASDALRIEITGPIGLHLSVVDLPGLISVSNEDQTDEDVEAVREMVQAYLRNTRTIILAVLQASNDMANQEIIKLAREHDPKGERTVGIITKPDLINGGAEEKLALVASNRDTIKLKLGFFLLKNPSPSELKEGLTMDTRSKRELRFFSSAVWAAQNLDMSRVGAINLRLFLQELLDTHIERELPKVREEIKRTLVGIEQDLKSLGEARPTVGHIRQFMINLSMRFYELFQAALDGNYHSIDTDFFAKNEGSRLRARVQELNTEFATHMRDSGQKRTIGTGFAKSESDHESTDETAQLIVSKKEMLQWIKKAYSRTRGKELPGNNNSALLSELFHEQSQRWSNLAEKHISDVLGLVYEWTNQAIGRLIREEKLSGEISAILHEWLAEAESLALEELGKLLDDERQSPLTYNHYYTDNVQKSRFDGQRTAVKNAVALVAAHDWNGKLHISNNNEDIERFVTAIGSRIVVDMDEQACLEAMTQLNAYYKVAMKTFVDNVTRQVIERHIIAPLPKAFCPSTVSNFSVEDLVRVASEQEHQSTKRANLASLAQSLKSSLTDLQRIPVEVAG